MESFVVSAATGALTPVLKKLADMLGSEYKRFKQVRREIQFLIDELEPMHAFLLKMSENEDPDAQEKAWTKEVREMSYDVEDCLDEFMIMLRADDRAAAAARNGGGLVHKVKGLWGKAKARRCVAKAIEDLRSKIKEVADRNARYRVAHQAPAASMMRRRTGCGYDCETVDRRALVIFEHASKLQGIDGPKHEVIRLLTNVDALVQSQLQVVSIVGVGGLGKTTLANQVYQELKARFNCHAFVSVTRNSDPRQVLRNMLCQVSCEPHYNMEAWDVQLLISKIIEPLRDNRYFVVIDDLWQTELWGIIKYALLENNKNSKIVTTTRMHDVAEACCSGGRDIVYKMRPLGNADARKLFFERIFGSEEMCPAHLIQVSNKILDKCGGLPLAVISISGLLANKPLTEDKWDTVQKSIGRSLGKDPDVKTMMQILSLSYFDLPNHLKSCLLYLGVFPEDSIIDKRCLVRRWAAEGFIQKEQGHTLDELGEMCFNELINRSMMQVFATNIYGEVISCKVHDAILDFIVSKSEGDNFITIFGDGYRKLDADSKVRRLSLHGCSQKDVSMLTFLDMSHVRSITVTSINDSVEKHPFLDLQDCGKVEGYTRPITDIEFNNSVEPSLLSPTFKYLRVLDFHGYRKLRDHHIANIGNLLWLKYLSFRETEISVLPEQIVNLQYMETLDLQNSKVQQLPQNVVQLSSLVHLLVNRGVLLPSGIGKMAALEELECVDVLKQSLEFTQELGQLANLRSISIYLCHDYYNNIAPGGIQYKEYMDNIVSSLCKVSNLSSLSIDIEPWCEADFCLDSGGGAPGGIQRMQITRGFISKVPNWVGCLINLQLLTLCVREFKPEDIMALGHLPALASMCLMAHESFQGRECSVSGSDGFRCLKSLKFGCAIPVTFGSGAMPNLESLTFMFSLLRTSQVVSNGDFHFGIQHLSNLKSVLVGLHLSCDAILSWIDERRTHMADLSCEAVTNTLANIDVIALYVGIGTEAAIRKAVLVHPKSPRLEIRHITQWKANGMMEYKELSIAHLLEAPSTEHAYLGPSHAVQSRRAHPFPLLSLQLQTKRDFAMQYFHDMIRDLKKQQRIRRCRLNLGFSNRSVKRLSSHDLHPGVPVSPAQRPASGASSALGLAAELPSHGQHSEQEQTLQELFIFSAGLPAAGEERPSQPGVVRLTPTPSPLAPCDQNGLSISFNNLSVDEPSLFVSSYGFRRHGLRRRAHHTPPPAVATAASGSRKRSRLPRLNGCSPRIACPQAAQA